MFNIELVSLVAWSAMVNKLWHRLHTLKIPSKLLILRLRTSPASSWLIVKISLFAHFSIRSQTYIYTGVINSTVKQERIYVPFNHSYVCNPSMFIYQGFLKKHLVVVFFSRFYKLFWQCLKLLNLWKIAKGLPLLKINYDVVLW